MASAQIPLFPLQSVLYPDGVLSLRVFEVRYLDLIQRCHKEKVPFGVVCLRQGSEVRRAPAPGETEPPVDVLHDIGTLAHIEVFERPQPGPLRDGPRRRAPTTHSAATRWHGVARCS
ncbi:LON peptidase substrate-binding domain-containing protein [Leptospira sp. 96542]|nr:LON peptidase substrate-binding domain-containing protein [Leptospira sp. 96542]